LSKSKKHFLIGAIIFLLILIFIVIDFSRRTKFRKFNNQKDEHSFIYSKGEGRNIDYFLAQKLISKDQNAILT
jgi:hypothetical protein